MEPRLKRQRTRRRQRDTRAKIDTPTCIDIFAGAGGLAEGFRQAGWRIISAADSDPHAADTFKLNFPEARFIRADIGQLAPAQLLAGSGLKPGQLDCLIGGPPCQSFSYNNHARSASNARARLFRQYLRIVESLRPKTLVMENVPGMLTIGNGKIITAIKKKLAELGYEVGIRILFAEDYGVPQRRRRLFIIGTRLDWDESLFPRGTHGPSAKPLLKSNPYAHRWLPQNGRRPKRFVTVWDAIGDLPPVRNGTGLPIARYTRAPQTYYQRRVRNRQNRLYNHVSHRLSERMVRRIISVPEGGNWQDIPRKLLPSGMKRARKSDHTTRYGRLKRSALCCTILTKCDPHWGSYIHPLQHRTITVREAARLQTFPDTFRLCDLISKQYEQIGNAVPPAMAKPIAKAIRHHIARASHG